MNAQELLPRSLKLLQGAIRASGMTQTEVDERIGRRRGYLSHVFQRRVDLKVEDLILALEALGIHPANFFETAGELQLSGSARTLRLVSQRTQPLPTVAPPPEKDQAILEERVRRALRSILGQLSSSEGSSTAAAKF